MTNYNPTGSTDSTDSTDSNDSNDLNDSTTDADATSKFNVIPRSWRYILFLTVATKVLVSLPMLSPRISTAEREAMGATGSISYVGSVRSSGRSSQTFSSDHFNSSNRTKSFSDSLERADSSGQPGSSPRSSSSSPLSDSNGITVTSDKVVNMDLRPASSWMRWLEEQTELIETPTRQQSADGQPQERRHDQTRDLRRGRYRRLLQHQVEKTAEIMMRGKSAAYLSTMHFSPGDLFAVPDHHDPAHDHEDYDHADQEEIQHWVQQSLQSYNDAIEEYNHKYRHYSRHEWALRADSEGADQNNPENPVGPIKNIFGFDNAGNMDTVNGINQFSDMDQSTDKTKKSKEDDQFNKVRNLKRRTNRDDAAGTNNGNTSNSSDNIDNKQSSDSAAKSVNITGKSFSSLNLGGMHPGPVISPEGQHQLDIDIRNYFSLDSSQPNRNNTIVSQNRSLVGTQWKLMESYIGDDTYQIPLSNHPITLKLSLLLSSSTSSSTSSSSSSQTSLSSSSSTSQSPQRVTIAGHAGCNSFHGSATISPSLSSSLQNKISIGMVATTRMMCNEEGVMQQEESFVKLLMGATFVYEFVGPQEDRWDNDGAIEQEVEKREGVMQQEFLTKKEEETLELLFRRVSNETNDGMDRIMARFIPLEEELIPPKQINSMMPPVVPSIISTSSKSVNTTTIDVQVKHEIQHISDLSFTAVEMMNGTSQIAPLVPILNGSKITLRFRLEGRSELENDVEIIEGSIHGNSGCNSYSGSLSFRFGSSSSLPSSETPSSSLLVTSIGHIMSTETWCNSKEIMNQESSFLTLLIHVKEFFMVEEKLKLLDEDKNVLIRFQLDKEGSWLSPSPTSSSSLSSSTSALPTASVENNNNIPMTPSVEMVEPRTYDEMTMQDILGRSFTAIEILNKINGTHLTPIVNGSNITLALELDQDGGQDKNEDGYNGAVVTYGGNINGNAGCNSYNGGISFRSTFSLSGPKLLVSSVGPLTSTAMWCISQEVMDQESLFLTLLGTVVHEFLIEEDEDDHGLVLLDVNRHVVVRFRLDDEEGGDTFELPNAVSMEESSVDTNDTMNPNPLPSDNAIVGILWLATEYYNGETLKLIAPDSGVTLTLDKETVFGNAGCNSYYGSLSTISPTSFEVGPIASTEMECVEKDMNDQEHSYLKNFHGGAIRYSILNGGTALELRSEDGNVIARYESNGPSFEQDAVDQSTPAVNMEPISLSASELRENRMRPVSLQSSGGQQKSAGKENSKQDGKQGAKQGGKQDRRPGKHGKQTNGSTRKKGGFFNAYQAAPLQQGYGTHYATIWVGTPSQRKSVIVDTGSHYTAFPCKGCDNCGESHHTDKYFDPDASSTFHALTCDECQASTCISDRCVFSQTYTEGSSWHAYESIDKVFLGGKELSSARSPIDSSFGINFLFGCQTKETGLFVTQLADGIMGMSAHPSTLPRAMFDKGKLEHNMFAMCFRRELHVSKQGVVAGMLTLGGIDTRVDFTPMVYARNVAMTGWFTVFVKNVYVRQNGGQSAKPDRRDQKILRVTVDLFEMNSGKGIIVDSGTTDTYLHKSIAEPFDEVWRRVTGRKYTNTPVKMSQKDLLLLPTILIQMSAYNSAPDPLVDEVELIPGLVGDLDPSSPQDVLLAIPATHYMEYSPSKGTYTPRIYFTESRGGVIGSNAMQGHNVLFDWENSRVGFAESSCEYQGYDTPSTEEGGMLVDCKLGAPSLSVSCSDSVDLSKCDYDSNSDMTLVGTEVWTRIVQAPGTEHGLTCEEVSISQNDSNGGDKMEVQCDGKGICREYRHCDITCANAIAAGSAGNDGNLSPIPGNVAGTCGGGTWSACDYTCSQTRINSVFMSDGKCHEEKALEFTRPCHVQACGRSDPCRVPFVVHAIFKIRGAIASRWNKQAEEVFAEAVATTVNDRRKEHDELFGPGDVITLLANPWRASDDTIFGDNSLDGEDEELGMQIVIEISIFNYDAILPPVDKKSSSISYSSESRSKIDSVVDNVKRSIGRKKIPLATCDDSDLHPLAFTAVSIHQELARPNFISSVMKHIKNDDKNDQAGTRPSPFSNTIEDGKLAELSKVVTSWTIKTDIGGEETGGFDFDSYTTDKLPVIIIVLSTFVVVAYWSWCIRSNRKQEHRQYHWPHTRLSDRNSGQRHRGDRRRGKYSRVQSSRRDSASVADDNTDMAIGDASSQYSNGRSISGDMEMASLESSSLGSLGSLSSYITRTR